MTEPEQWAVELFRKAVEAYGGQSIPGETECYAARLIQRAFEERERELREALVAVDGELRTAWEERSLPARCISGATIAKINKALATRQDAPVTENSHDQ